MTTDNDQTAAQSAAPTTSALVLKATCGPEAAERLNQALTVAATATASGVRVSLWLTGEATWLAVADRSAQTSAEAALPHAAPLSDLLDAVLEAGTVTVCGQCAARRDLTPGDLVEGAKIRGAAAFVEEIMASGTQALVY